MIPCYNSNSASIHGLKKYDTNTIGSNGSDVEQGETKECENEIESSCCTPPVYGQSVSLNAAIDKTRIMITIVMSIGILFWILYTASFLQIITVLSVLERIPTAAVFIGTLMLFLSHCALNLRYDALVRQRHTMLSVDSEVSQRIVQEIFPMTVRDRLYEQQPVSLQHRQFYGKQQRRRSTGDLPFEPRSSQQHQEMIQNGKCLQQHASDCSKLPPIVDSYSSATVLFADIAGFTSWSSQRDPIQVFQLLEHLFAAFDRAAIKYRVFKVETIGDSYMAVAGLPELDQNHSIHMARFACAMLDEMDRALNELQLIGIKDLSLRIGMNSGPVTAGVLRGKKARFQLFGDTVNTASRMESTGIPGKIQVSQSTATLLQLSDKGLWLEQRADKIVAKGKGELTTFWLLKHVVDIVEDVNYRRYSYSVAQPKLTVTIGDIDVFSVVSDHMPLDDNGGNDDVMMLPFTSATNSSKQFACHVTQARQRTPARSKVVSTM